MSAQAYRPYRTIERRNCRQIQVGSVAVGGDAPISVQTMTNTLFLLSGPAWLNAPFPLLQLSLQSLNFL